MPHRLASRLSYVVSSIPFGLVQGAIGRIQYSVDRIMNLAVIHGSTNTHRNMTNLAFRVQNIQCFNGASNLFSHKDGAVGISFSEHDDELFSTVARGNIGAARQL